MAAPDASIEQQQQPSPSVIKSFVHRRQPSKGEALVPEPLSAEIQNISDHAAMGVGRFAKNDPGALGELQQNQQEAAPRAYRQSRDDYGENARGRSRSPTKNILNPFKPSSKDVSKKSEARSASPTKKPKKVKSGTNLAGLLSRPKSIKDLYKTAAEEEAKLEKNKENRTPDLALDMAPPPIFAQFTSDASVRQSAKDRASVDVQRNASSQELHTSSRPAMKERPKSYQVAPSPRPPQPSPIATEASPTDSRSYRNRAMNALTGRGHSRTKSAAASPVTPSTPADPTLDPKDIDKHLEAMLDRRNIPENQRYKMRNLNDTIKMEFIRQDWAEMAASKADRPGTTDSINSKEGDSAVTAGTDDEERPKKSRGRSFTSTFSRSKKDSRSPSKKREGTLGRHFRSKSSESVVSDRPTSSSGPTTTNSILSKIKLQQGPADYVAYLRKVQKPEAVEVGKIHKLRLLLRNETVAWIEEFMQQGGMKEIVGLLNRIMEVEWREEHEDALLHEVLLCLKALSTTARGMAYLHTIQSSLFPKLLHMIFDPERKGPSEFTTRGIITFVLFTYIESAAPNERVARAKNVLSHLRDPQPEEKEQPLAFVMDMRQDRPYRVWNKEVVSVTKEVFWIFLHNLNVVPLEKRTDVSASSVVTESYGYMHRHFPQERPPVPAAPYVGGVEWDATNYLASHLDLLNAIIACTPTKEQRNALRADLRISGWERVMGASLRLCKEKFYGSVHDGLRTWVGAAAEDGWEVRDVRYGPAPEVKRSPKKGAAAAAKGEAAPQLDVPKLDLGAGAKADDGWIS